MKIQIKEPCRQNWNSMLPTEKGRHCSLCDKVVIDFTEMNSEEIKNYFLKNCEQKTCGHFRAYQVGHSNNFLTAQLLTIRTKLISFENKMIWPKLALSIVGFLLVLSGCESKKTGAPFINGDTIMIPKSEVVVDTLTNKTIQRDPTK